MFQSNSIQVSKLTNSEKSIINNCGVGDIEEEEEKQPKQFETKIDSIQNNDELLSIDQNPTISISATSTTISLSNNTESMINYLSTNLAEIHTTINGGSSSNDVMIPFEEVEIGELEMNEEIQLESSIHDDHAHSTKLLHGNSMESFETIDKPSLLPIDKSMNYLANFTLPPIPDAT